jgi:hypothetical protein
MRAQVGLVTVAALAAVVGGCLHQADPSPERMRSDAEILSEALPVLEEHRVEWFEDLGWCSFLDASIGQYADVDEDEEMTSCDVNGVAEPFDPDAQAVFDRIRDRLDATGLSVSTVVADVASDGTLMRATFSVAAGMYDRWYYVYEPGGELPEDMEAELRSVRIDANWYWQWEDWN